MARSESPSPPDKFPAEDSHERGATQDDYSMLAEMWRYQQDRFKNHAAVFMSILSGLLGFIVWFIAEQTRISIAEKYAVILLAGLAGFAASLAWILVMRRIVREGQLRLFQLRYCERAMNRPYCVFTEGYRFFIDKDRRTTTPDGETLPFEDHWAKVPVKWTLQILASLYALAFLLSMLGAVYRLAGLPAALGVLIIVAVGVGILNSVLKRWAEPSCVAGATREQHRDESG